MTKFNTNFNATLPFTDLATVIQLGQATAVSMTVPGESWQKYRAEIRSISGDYIWVALNKTAVIPTPGAATAIPNQEFAGQELVRYVKGGDTLSFITTQTAGVQCGVSLLELPSAK
jgi:hypothetical protein